MSISIYEFLQRIRVRSKGNLWSILIISDVNNQQIVKDLQDTLSIFAECEVGCLSAKNGISDLKEKMINAPEDYLIIWDFEKWDENNWYKFDCFRSLFKRKGGIVLILSPESAKTMLSEAKNTSSWLEYKVYNFVQDTEILTEEEIKQRLKALREWSGLTDSQVIEMAENRILPTDPEYGEWLVLLDRGDLIVQ
jgi:hypothetical protein